MNKISKTIVCLGFLILATSCLSPSSPEPPQWVQNKIEALQDEPPRDPPAKIYEWVLVNGERYYYLPPYCCDAFSELYDEDGRLICHPDGGIGGGGDGQCPNLPRIVSRRLIWEDSRQ